MYTKEAWTMMMNHAIDAKENEMNKLAKQYAQEAISIATRLDDKELIEKSKQLIQLIERL